MHETLHGHGMPHEHPPIDIEGIDPVSREVVHALRSSMMLQKRLMMKLLASRAAHPAQALCLGVLAHRDGMSQSEIADMMHVTRPTVTAMLQRLESAGVVERRPDSLDQRITRVFLTAEGQRHAEHAREVQRKAVDVSLAWMDEADRVELARLLNAMNDRIRAALADDTISADDRGSRAGADGTNPETAAAGPGRGGRP
ncbi:MAG: MarR family winged helix-turn-helix transcriptional regulator [Coriobacteriia bacterium]